MKTNIGLFFRLTLPLWRHIYDRLRPVRCTRRWTIGGPVDHWTKWTQVLGLPWKISHRTVKISGTVCNASLTDPCFMAADNFYIYGCIHQKTTRQCKHKSNERIEKLSIFYKWTKYWIKNWSAQMLLKWQKNAFHNIKWEKSSWNYYFNTFHFLVDFH